MSILFFLDDERVIEDVSWVKYKEYDSIITFRTSKQLQGHLIRYKKELDWSSIHFSLDHDLQEFYTQEGIIEEYTGYTFAKWLCDYLEETGLSLNCLKTLTVHSKNPIGQENIYSYVKNYLKFKGEEDGNCST